MNQDINEQLSIKDKQINAVLYVKESSAMMRDLTEELNRMYDVIRDNELSNRTKNSELIKLKRTVIPFVYDTAKQFFNHSKILSSTAALDYVHKREECKKRKGTEENRSSTTEKLKNLNLTRIENSISPKSTSKDKNSKKRSVLRLITINKSNDEDKYFRKKISNTKISIPKIHRLRSSPFAKK